MRGRLPSKILLLCLLLPLSVRSSAELKDETLDIPTQLCTVSYAFYYGVMSSFIACNNIIDFNTSMSLPMLAGVMRFIGSIGIDYLNSCKPLLFYLSKEYTVERRFYIQKAIEHMMGTYMAFGVTKAISLAIQYKTGSYSGTLSALTKEVLPWLVIAGAGAAFMRSTKRYSTLRNVLSAQTITTSIHSYFNPLHYSRNYFRSVEWVYDAVRVSLVASLTSIDEYERVWNFITRKKSMHKKIHRDDICLINEIENKPNIVVLNKDIFDSLYKAVQYGKRRRAPLFMVGVNWLFDRSYNVFSASQDKKIINLMNNSVDVDALVAPTS